MKLTELLNTLAKLAQDNNLAAPYIVGGLPRDKVFGIAAQVRDIDITTGDTGSLQLGILASKVWADAGFRIYNDGHCRLTFSNIALDMSNNFRLPNINTELEKLGITEPTDLHKEMFSRDFTINTLLQPMDLGKNPLDITGKALEDIKNKVLRTPVNPELTIGYDQRRILRALKMMLKFGLTIDEELKEVILKYRGGLAELPLNYIKKQINELLRLDAKKAIELMSEFKLLPMVPLSKLMTQELSKKNMIQYLLDS